MAGRVWGAGARVPGDVLVHPLALASLALLLLNDHLLKREFPGVVTGKLSDIAAMVFCPLLLAAVVEIGRRAVGRRRFVLPTTAVVVLCVAVGVGFAAMKLSTGVAEVYGEVVGALRAVGGGGLRPVEIAHDPSDAFSSLGVVLPLNLLHMREKHDLRESRV